MIIYTFNDTRDIHDDIITPLDLPILLQVEFYQIPLIEKWMLRGSLKYTT